MDAHRICHLASGDGWGGAEAVIANLLRGCATRADLSVSLVVLNEGRLADEARAAGVSVYVVPEGDRSFAALVWAVAAILRRLQPHVVHTHRYKENLLGFLLAKSVGARSVVTLHGYEPPLGGAARAVYALRGSVSNLLARRADARFVGVSTVVAERLRIPSDRCTVIPNGVTLPAISEVQRTRASSLSRSPAVGWLGRLVPVKSVDTLIRAMAQLGADLGGARLILVGDGPERDRLQRNARELGLGERVEFRGFVADPSPLWREIDVFALPSLHEGAPMALLEALAHQVPVVAAAVGGIPGLIGDSGAARLIDSRDPAIWARELAAVLADSRTRDALGERGRRLVEERYSLASMVERYVEVYCEARGSTGRTSAGASPAQ